MGDVAALTWPLTRPGIGPYDLELARRARRCLFGLVDHKETRILLEKETENLYQEDRERWNFDFQSECPLPAGRFQWKRIGEEESVDADNDGGSREENADIEHEIASTTPKKEQTHITDFMRKRKLSSNQKEALTSQSKTRRRSST